MLPQKKIRITIATTAQLFDERGVSVCDGARIQLRAVVRGAAFTPGGSPGSISFSLAFTRSITASAFSPCRMMTIPRPPRPCHRDRPRRGACPGRASPFPVAHRMGTPVGLTASEMFSRSAVGARVSPPAPPCIAARELHQPPAPRRCFRRAPRPPLRDRHAVRRQPVAIHVHLVLPHEAAQRRNSATPRHRLQVIPQVPILNGAQLRQVMPPLSTSAY